MVKKLKATLNSFLYRIFVLLTVHSNTRPSVFVKIYVNLLKHGGKGNRDTERVSSSPMTFRSKGIFDHRWPIIENFNLRIYV